MTRIRSRRPSARDVAELAQVSVAAVSRAFTPNASIAPETRARVVDAARQLGYRPSALPRMLQTDRSSLVALIMGELTNPFYPEILSLFLRELKSVGLHPLVFALEPNDVADAVIDDVFRYRVDGVIVTSATISSERAKECSRLDVPVVLFNRHVPDPEILSICCDNEGASRHIADLLLDAGHQRPALIAGNPSDVTDQDREHGFIGRLRERGRPHVPRYFGENSYEDGAAGVRALFGGDSKPDAVFCLSDVVALGALDELRFGQGLRVPEDVSVIGFDHVPAADWSSYRLTTYAQPRELMVSETVRILQAAISRESSIEYSKLLPGAFVRGSTARIRE